MDIRALFTEAGFELVHPFDAHAVARAVGVGALVDADRPCGWLVASTRTLWPRLLAACRADRELAENSDPLDLYTERTCLQIPDARCLFPHRRYDGGAFLPFQRIAAAAGMGTLAPTQLLVHPVYGPWFGLRAVVLTAGTPTTHVLPPAPCDCSDRCTAAFERARHAGDDWRAWLAVRDACCVGSVHRYGKDQLEYHYTKNRALVR